jgi:lipoprotein-releasing system permease protein
VSVATSSQPTGDGRAGIRTGGATPFVVEAGIAWRYLRSRRGSRLLSLISVIAIGGVLVGVSALIVIMGVMNGLQRDLREKILVGSPDIRVLTFGDDLRMARWEGTAATVRRTAGVVAVAPFVQTEGLVNAGRDFTTGAQVVGLEPDGRGVVDVTTIRRHAIHGDFRFASADGRGRGAVLGRLLAQKLNAFVGDRITLIGRAGLQVNAATGQVVPRATTFEVTGIFETGMYEYDNAYIYVALDAAREFAGLGADVTGLEVRTADRWQAPRVGAAIVAALGPPYRAVDWQEQNRSLFQALKLEKLGMSVILLLIVLVAAFNIVSTLTMVVADKTREIGILRAMGLTARSVQRVFLLQGVTIGFVGTAGGVLLGLGASVALERYELIALDPSVYFIDHLPVALEPLDVVLIVLASVAIAALATLYPARQAARLEPVDAIRHD